jgi:hypothetical protein
MWFFSLTFENKKTYATLAELLYLMKAEGFVFVD